jgi:HK97 family phage prohead protease
MRQSVAAAIRSVGPRGFRFTAVTARKGRDGHVLLPQGVDFTNYKRNPVVLWQHNQTSPVARCSGLSLIDSELRGSAEFPPVDTSELADEICGLVKSGIVSAVSVGFDVLESEPLDPKQPRGGQRITRSELLELSLVSVPADTGAVITERGYRKGAMMSAEASKNLVRLDEHISKVCVTTPMSPRHCAGGMMTLPSDRTAAWVSAWSVPTAVCVRSTPKACISTKKRLRKRRTPMEWATEHPIIWSPCRAPNVGPKH